jgi:hypothetical protein
MQPCGIAARFVGEASVHELLKQVAESVSASE